jgi:signal transduction histidine kinase
LLAFAFFVAAYHSAFVAARAFAPAIASPFWFPDSVLLCALLLSPPRWWWVFILGTFPGRIAPAMTSGMPAWYLLATYAIDCGAGVTTALALRRFMRNALRFESLRDLAVFCLWAVVLIPASDAALGAWAGVGRGWAFETTWRQWFLGVALSQLVVTPALLYWVVRPAWKIGADHLRWLEAGLLAAGLIATGILAFDTHLGFDEPRFFAPVLFLVWAAVRFGMPGASGAIATIAFIAIEAAVDGRGPFSGHSPEETALALQRFLLLRAAPLYAVAVLVEQRGGFERSLHTSEKRMSLAAAAIKLKICEWDVARDLLWVIDPAQEGPPAAPVTLAGFMQTMHPDDRDTALSGLERAIRGGGGPEGRYRTLLPDGGFRWMAWAGQVEFDDAGKPLWVRAVGRDVTHLVTVEQETQLQRDELVHLSRVAMLGEMSGAIAHELNQPLGAILTNAQTAKRLLARPNPDSAELSEILDDIVSDDHRAVETIRGLRQLFQKAPAQQKTRPLDLNLVVREALKLAQSELQIARVELRTELSELPAIDGDRIQLQQLLLNLISNACNAMAGVDGGRELTVRTGFTDSEGVHVTVSDRGDGIPADNLSHLFDPFFTTRPGGMGLGLTVCRTIASAHHGKLWAENNPDRGASFHFVVPWRPQPRQ